ncbi:MAG TPA: sigma-70 family RNA polymerase sigma factor [Solirubrobacteraceae bacterium]|nr:sigma-70 family RNA polymerase sigma factor [Solirubrobacteraceae bacterium]
MAISPVQERELLAAAREGDERAFERLVQPRHNELHAHCYRMTGSVHDAEDALQEALLRAWRGMRRFEGKSSLRSWLYRIATNTCLDTIGKRPKRVLPIDYGPGADPHDSPGAPLAASVWIEPYPDGLLGGDLFASPEASYEQRESVELAFIAALQHLPAQQRAVLILRAVLGFSAREVADALETSVASVNSALQRARKAVDEKLPDQSQQETLRAVGDARLTQIVDDYMAALQSGDVERVLALLTEDATWSMPPLPVWFRGRAAVSGFLTDYGLTPDWRHVPTRANGQLAVGCYILDPDRGAYRIAVLDILTLRGELVHEVTAFLAPWLYERFGEGVEGVMTPAVYATFGLAEELPA